MLSIESLIGIILSEAREVPCRLCGTVPSNVRDSDRCRHDFTVSKPPAHPTEKDDG